MINVILFVVVTGLAFGLGILSKRLAQTNRLLVFVPAALTLAVAFVLAGLPDFLDFLSFEVLFALTLLLLFSGIVNALFAIYYFVKIRKQA